MTMSDRDPRRWAATPAPREEEAPEEDEAEAAEDSGAWGRSAARRRRRARRRAAALARSIGPAELPAPGAPGGPPDAVAAPDPGAIAEREQRIEAIQAALVRRRRRRAIGLALRLFLLVVLPTAVVGWYYATRATPMYETKSEFTIQKADLPAGASGLGSLFSGFGMADAKDSIAVQGFLGSMAAMDRLDAEHGFIARFQDPAIDPLQRLAPDATRAEAHELYRKRVIVGFDVTEGILRMSVIAPDPESSVAWSRALISYAEEMVDQLSARARAENMRDAERSLAEREADVRAAAERVLELQRQYDTFSAESELQIDLAVIQAQELELEKLRRERAELLANPRPNAAQLGLIERSIAFTEAAIARRRAALTEGGEGRQQSLATIATQLKMAQSDLAAREQMRIVALNALEQARREAARQVRFLSVSVPPIAPDRPTHPRVAENTAVAFLVFLGLYIMVSLTLSILREQVSV